MEIQFEDIDSRERENIQDLKELRELYGEVLFSDSRIALNGGRFVQLTRFPKIEAYVCEFAGLVNFFSLPHCFLIEGKPCWKKE